MLNEDKIKLMTGIAIFEKREGKKLLTANRYFKSDYVSSKMIRSFFAYSLCYMMCLILWALYNIEELLNTIAIDKMESLGKTICIYYAIGLIIYLFITFLVYSKRYEHAVKSTKLYAAKLKRLDKRYEFQDRTKELVKEGGRNDGSTRI